MQVGGDAAAWPSGSGRGLQNLLPRFNSGRRLSSPRVWGLTLAITSALAGAAPQGAAESLRLATTTSTEGSGLLARLLPPFERKTGIAVHVIAVGSGQALRLASNGDADLVLSHAPDLERSFVENGDGVNPREVMYNDFVIVGPPANPAGIVRGEGPAEALRRIAASGAGFVSRGDDSGTHQQERALWKAAGVEPAGEGYLEAGQGMGAVLVLANEREAYTLADRGTLLAFRRKLELEIVVEGHPALFNRYTVIATNPAKHPGIRYAEAMALIAWLTGPEGQGRIADYRLAGERLFHPLAIPAPSD